MFQNELFIIRMHIILLNVCPYVITRDYKSLFEKGPDQINYDFMPTVFPGQFPRSSPDKADSLSR